MNERRFILMYIIDMIGMGRRNFIIDGQIRRRNFLRYQAIPMQGSEERMRFDFLCAVTRARARRSM